VPFLKTAGTLVDGLNASGDYIDAEYVFPISPGGIPGFGAVPTGLPVQRDLNYLVNNGTQGSVPTVPTNAGPATTFPVGAPDVVNLTTSSDNLGDAAGAFQGPFVGNSFPAQVLGGVNQQGPILSPLGAAVTNVRTVVRKAGIGWVLCGVAAGGSTLSIGQYANVATGSVYAAQGARTAGNSVGRISAYPINTTVFSAVAAGSNVVIPLSSPSPLATGVVGITTSTPVTIGAGSTQETVTPSAVTQGVLASQTLTIAGTPGTNTITVTIGGGSSIFPAVTVAVNVTSSNTATTAAAAIVAAFNASAAVLTGAGFTVPFLQVVTNSAGVITFVANALTPAAAYNAIPITATVTGAGGFTATTGAATFAGGVNPSITATIANAHAAGEPVQGINKSSSSALMVAPSVGVLTAALLADIVCLSAL
jgi:hypothetical protein